MPNPYLDALGTIESPLYNDLYRESIYNHGIGAKYLPRESVNVDDILGKSEGSFSEAFDIDVVITSSTNLDSDSEIFQRFGIQIDKTINLSAHKDTFLSIVGKEPLKGDLLYLEPWDLLLEITAPNSQNVLSFGKQFVYDFSTVIFENRGEEFNTGLEQIDDTAQEYIADLSVADDTPSITQRFTDLVQFTEDNPFSNTF